jgi:hypothetical protein
VKKLAIVVTFSLAFIAITTSNARASCYYLNTEDQVNCQRGELDSLHRKLEDARNAPDELNQIKEWRIIFDSTERSSGRRDF